MSRKKEYLSSSGISKTIFSSFFTVIFIYSVLLLVAFLSARYILLRKTWLGKEFLYPLFSTINDNPVMFLALCWLIGSVLVFLFYWRRTLGYISTVVEASNRLVASDEDFIHLPPELKQMEDRMNQIKQDAIRNARLAKEAEQRKNDLIVYLAHDLKTPLTSVIGYLTLLRDEQKISDELREKYLSISLDKAQRLEDLINEFFEITRFNLSQITLEISHISLTRMLEQIAFEFRPLFEAKNLQCTVHSAANIEIQLDADKMERVFDNLIRNAVNYSFENSQIEITASQRQDGVYISFKNRGHTIPKEKLGRIFEQFYRLDTSRATKTGGAGLGLAIAKEIVELHHGTITAASENEMIEFVVFLPSHL